jgi:hypothetical protein
MAEIVQQFNAESQSAAWPDTAFVALATWFAAQLPETYTQYDFDSGINPAPQTTVAITPEHRAAYITALAEEMKKVPPAKNRYGGEYIEIDSSIDIGGGATNPPVWDALEKAGIGDAFAELELVRAYIHKDGQVFAKSQPIDHEGRPKIQYTRERDLDYTGCPWMRQDSRYLVTPLPAGKPACSVRRLKDGTYDYREKIAGEGEVLVIPAYANEAFASLTQNDALNLRYRDNIRFAMIGKAADYADGASDGRSTFEQLDGHGHFRRLSAPFQLFTARAPFATGCDSEYYVMQQGDCLKRTPEGDKDWASHEIVPKEWIDSNRRTFLPCAPDGTLCDLTTLDKPVAASRPLKLKTPVEPK